MALIFWKTESQKPTWSHMTRKRLPQFSVTRAEQDLIPYRPIPAIYIWTRCLQFLRMLYPSSRSCRFSMRFGSCVFTESLYFVKFSYLIWKFYIYSKRFAMLRNSQVWIHGWIRKYSYFFLAQEQSPGLRYRLLPKPLTAQREFIIWIHWYS